MSPRTTRIHTDWLSIFDLLIAKWMIVVPCHVEDPVTYVACLCIVVLTWLRLTAVLFSRTQCGRSKPIYYIIWMVMCSARVEWIYDFPLARVARRSQIVCSSASTLTYLATSSRHLFICDGVRRWEPPLGSAYPMYVNFCHQSVWIILAKVSQSSGTMNNAHVSSFSVLLPVSIPLL